MAQSSRGVTIHQMMVMMDRHLRTETYASATSVLVDAQQEHPFAAIWGGWACVILGRAVFSCGWTRRSQPRI
ncbi:Tn3 family transposase [Escherichia coli]